MLTASHAGHGCTGTVFGRGVEICIGAPRQQRAPCQRAMLPDELGELHEDPGWSETEPPGAGDALAPPRLGAGTGHRGASRGDLPAVTSLHLPLRQRGTSLVPSQTAARHAAGGRRGKQHDASPSSGPAPPS